MGIARPPYATPNRLELLRHYRRPRYRRSSAATALRFQLVTGRPNDMLSASSELTETR